MPPNSFGRTIRGDVVLEGANGRESKRCVGRHVQTDRQAVHPRVLEAQVDSLDSDGATNDAALDLLANHREEVAHFDPNSPAAKRVLRKIDLHIMTMVFAVYCLQLVDKNSLSYAQIEGLSKATDLTSSEYSWLGSIVYLGYLGGDIPAAYCLQRFDTVKYFGMMTVAWGIVVGCQGACSNFSGLAVCRFLLGFIEVCTVPAVFMMLVPPCCRLNLLRPARRRTTRRRSRSPGWPCGILPAQWQASLEVSLLGVFTGQVHSDGEPCVSGSTLATGR